MYAILKVPMETIQKGCTAVSTKNSVVMPANINSSNQVVISGHKEACENFVSWLKENYQENESRPNLFCKYFKPYKKF